MLLFQLLKYKKLRKSKCKKIYFRCRPPKFWVQNIFNYNLQQNLSFFSTPPGIIYRVESSHHRCAVKIGVLRNSTKFTRKHLCQSLFFNIVSGLRPATLFKMWLYHRCFPVNFVKFLRTHFYIEHLWWLLSRVFLKILKTLKILLLSQKVVLPPLCWDTFFVSISLDLLSYLDHKIF